MRNLPLLTCYMYVTETEASKSKRNPFTLKQLELWRTKKASPSKVYNEWFKNAGPKFCGEYAEIINRPMPIMLS